MIEIRVTGDAELIAQLDSALSRAVPEVTAVVEQGATNVKTDWVRAWSGFRHAPKLAAAVTSDVYALPGSVRAEIGPDKGKRQGALGNLVEFGSINNPPHPGGLPALQAEEPRLETALSELAERLIGG